jgi:TolB protein
MRALVLPLALVACRASAPAPLDPNFEPRVLLHENGVENAYPRLAADGRSILYQSNRTGIWQLYVLDLASGTSRALTHEGNNTLPDYSPDDQHIAFVSDRDGNEEIYLANADGTGARRLTTNPGRDIHPYFSPDGRTLLYNSQRGTGAFDIHAIDLATGSEQQLTAPREDETCARLAPDGAQLVFLRNDPNADDIWLRDPQGREHNITATPHVRDGWPVFSPDGRRIYYAAMTTGSFSIYRVNLDGSHVERVTTAAANEEDARPFVSRDGTRLVFNRRRGGAIDIVERSLVSASARP